MNINMLRDADDNVGIYLGGAPATGSTAGWGASVWQSSDNGATYNSVLNLTAAATQGVTTSVLGVDYNYGKKVDERNSVTVKLQYGTLASVTFSQFLNGAQMCVIGDEIMLFREALLVSAMTYRLRGFLRGFRGSEGQIGNHANGERFVLVNTETIKRITGSTADIGRTWLFKAVTIGQQLDAAVAQSFTYSGAGLMPYAPCQIGGGRSGAGDVILKWVRRNRTSGEWRSLVDVPMTESTEAYQVDIYSDGTYTTVKRTLQSTSPTVTYTAAQQNTDFGSLQSTVYFKVYQMSGTVGRGYPAAGRV